MLRCTNRDTTATRAKSLSTLDTKGRTKGIPPWFMTHFVGYIKHALDHEGDVPTTDDRIRQAYMAQNRIGSLKLLRGFIATAWARTLTDMGVANTQRCMVTLTRALWDEVVMPIWTTRNHNLHNNPNFTTDLTNAQLGERLLWYIQHKDQLSRQDQFLARYSAADIDSMSMTIQNEWVRHLDTARNAWAKEQQIIKTGQTLLTRYFHPLHRNK